MEAISERIWLGHDDNDDNEEMKLSAYGLIRQMRSLDVVV